MLITKLNTIGLVLYNYNNNNNNNNNNYYYYY